MSKQETYYTVRYTEAAEYVQIIRSSSAKEALKKFKEELHADKYEPDEVYVEDCEVTDISAVGV